MATKKLHALGEVRIVGHGQPTLCCGDDFHRMKAKNGDIAILASPDFAALITTTYGVGRIFDDLEAKALR